MLKGKIGVAHLLLPLSLWVSPVTATPAFLPRRRLVLVLKAIFIYFIYLCIYLAVCLHFPDVYNW